MSRTVAIIQARLNSSRLPGKVLYELAGRPALVLLIERIRRTAGIDEVVLATGDNAGNVALSEIVSALGVPVFMGPEDDVLARFALAAAEFKADTVVRLTGDCPFADPEVVGSVIAARSAGDFDYCTNVHPPTWPDGLDVSVFTRRALDMAHREARLPSEREHVVTWMWKHSPLEGGSTLRAANIPCPEDMSASRWTLDYAADYRMLRAVIAEIGPDRIVDAGWREINAILARLPEIAEMNKDAERDAGLAKSLKMDKLA